MDPYGVGMVPTFLSDGPEGSPTSVNSLINPTPQTHRFRFPYCPFAGYVNMTSALLAGIVLATDHNTVARGAQALRRPQG